MKLTKEIIHSFGTSEGGWNKTQLSLLNVKWPPEKGWITGLIGKEIPEETYNTLIALQGIRKGRRRAAVLHDDLFL